MRDYAAGLLKSICTLHVKGSHDYSYRSMKKHLLTVIYVLLGFGCNTTPMFLTSSQQLVISNAARDRFTKELELTKNEREFVDNTNPLFSYYFMAYPYAQYRITWSPPDGREIKVFGTGNVFELENAKVAVE